MPVTVSCFLSVCFFMHRPNRIIPHLSIVNVLSSSESQKLTEVPES